MSRIDPEKLLRIRDARPSAKHAEFMRFGAVHHSMSAKLSISGPRVADLPPSRKRARGLWAKVTGLARPFHKATQSTGQAQGAPSPAVAKPRDAGTTAPAKAAEPSSTQDETAGARRTKTEDLLHDLDSQKENLTAEEVQALCDLRLVKLLASAQRDRKGPTCISKARTTC